MSSHPTPAPPVEWEGEKFRRCVAALVFNADGDVLVGERVGKPGNWQLPQGGLDAGEDEVAAAKRELYEEMGVQCEPLWAVPTDPQRSCYRVNVEGSWLQKNGLAGQHLAFVAFLKDTRDDPSSFCDLSGLGGEKPEFAQAKWQPVDQVVDAVWEPKRPPYKHAMEYALPRIRALLKRV